MLFWGHLGKTTGARVGISHECSEVCSTGDALARQLKLVWAWVLGCTGAHLTGWLVYLDHTLTHSIKMEGECKKWLTGASDPRDTSSCSLPIWQTLGLVNEFPSHIVKMSFKLSFLLCPRAGKSVWAPQ